MISAPAGAYRAAHEAAVLAPAGLGVVRFTGPDRRKTLQGLTSNDVLALKPGQGQASCVLTPKGKLVASFMLYDLGEEFLAVLRPQAAGPMMQALSKPLMPSETRMDDVSSRWSVFGLFGPRAPSLAAGAGGDVPAVRYPYYGLDGFWLLAPAERGPAVSEGLSRAGASPADAGVLEVLRVEAGVPGFGRDLDADCLPAEAGLDEVAVSFTKGCFLGQEAAARLRNLGHVNRRLACVRIEGRPREGAEVVTDGKRLARLTSVVESPRLGAALGLALLPAAASAPGTRLGVLEGGRELAAEVVLPPAF